MPANPDPDPTPLASRRYAAPALLVLGILFGLFVLGAQPMAVNLIPALRDKLAHAVVFAVLACAMGLISGLRGWRMALWVGAIALLTF